MAVPAKAAVAVANCALIACHLLDDLDIQQMASGKPVTIVKQGLHGHPRRAEHDTHVFLQSSLTTFIIAMTSHITSALV